ncbi:GNAT family N-acetyltransferase [Kutzneria sp. NPDC052558]|uniref:GNAT family N-acetyltransferase n=1 Tax=Kutzneria sp. NPDC052558 TaxID=3364121 RepID=UPI0037CAFDB3
MFARAELADIGDLLQLYRRVYGTSYALPLGTDPEVMAAEIASDRTIWLVARDPATHRLLASIMATVDPADRMGKLQGLVVDPEHRRGGIAHDAVGTLADMVLAQGLADSVYGTARTTSTAPQRICQRNGFHAMGIFPNLRKADRHETMVLLTRYREGVLDQRHPVARVPAELAGLIDAVEQQIPWRRRPEIAAAPTARPVPAPTPSTVELVDAPRFVLKRFDEMVTDPVRRFYPFHTPNVMLTDTEAGYELYAHLSPGDGYCTLVGAAPTPMAVADHLDRIITQLNNFGAYYVESLVPMDAFEELTALLGNGFLPVAAYPAMRRDGELFRDYVVMARTMQPLDLRGLAIDNAFRPFTEQYIDLWKQQYLNTHGVFR